MMHRHRAKRHAERTSTRVPRFRLGRVELLASREPATEVRMGNAEGPFRHAVASGDPLADRVVIWTRVTTEGTARVQLGWTMARDPELLDIVAGGSVTADPDADFTAHVDVGGLDPDTHYWYGFSMDEERSPVARTRTLPARTEHLRFAMVSCAKFNAGFLNAYGRIADRDDVQFLLHLGDYIYEASENPPASQTKSKDIGRPFDPLHECVTLEDYRTRYAQYRGDPDVQRLHLAHPLIATVDDHEFADGAWRGGSTEHREERDGPWADRQAAAFRARWEWMPYRMPVPDDPSRVWRSVELGGLAELFLIDTRSRRDNPEETDFSTDRAHSQLGPEQKAWLFEGLTGSEARWRLLGNGSCMTHLWRDPMPEAARVGVLALKLTNPGYDGPDPDQWDGYPFERDEVLTALDAGGRGNAVVLSGDVHIGLASELHHDPYSAEDRPVAVELVTTSLTSQNVDDKKGWPPDTGSVPMEDAFVEAMPHVKWTDFDGHGYVLVDVTPERLRAEWWFVDEVIRRTPAEHLDAAFEVTHGTPRLTRTD
jgi:alkaline phosphatase D